VAAKNQDFDLAAKALEKAYEEQKDQPLDKQDLLVLADAYGRTQQQAKAVLVYQHLT